MLNMSSSNFVVKTWWYNFFFYGPWLNLLMAPLHISWKYKVLCAEKLVKIIFTNELLRQAGFGGFKYTNTELVRNENILILKV